ncbi:MAG: GNAT family N-acetyltransferase [Candidatus Nitrosotenuis sp.]
MARSKILIRKIRQGDLQNGFLESLDSLRKASNIDGRKANTILKKIMSNPAHVIFVAEMNGIIVGATTLLVEQKFIHKGGKVGHIEDVAVSKKFQGRGIGEMIIKAALKHAKKMGCYKTILDCNEDVIGFYEKMGFKKQSYCMRYDH